MGGIYWSPISRLLEIVLGAGAIAIVYLMARSFMSKHAWGDGAEYEMLDLAMPGEDADEAALAELGEETGGVRPTSDVETDFGVEEDTAALQGLIGLEDRIVRFGFSIALLYLSITWFGIQSVAMWLFMTPVFYLAVTGFIGKDPVYRWVGISTHFD